MEPTNAILRVECPMCACVRDAVVIAEVEGITSGCDSCGDGQAAEITVRVQCTVGHVVWQRTGDAAGVL